MIIERSSSFGRPAAGSQIVGRVPARADTLDFGGSFGLTFIAALPGGPADGLKGNGTLILYQVGALSATANYDAGADTIDITVDNRISAAANAAAVAAGLSGSFVVGAGTGTPTGTASNGIFAAFSGGSDTATSQLPHMVLSQGITLTSRPTNTAIFYVGGPAVTTASGYPLRPGEELFLPVRSPDQVYIVSNLTNQPVAWWGI